MRSTKILEQKDHDFFVSEFKILDFPKKIGGDDWSMYFRKTDALNDVTVSK